MYADAPIRCDGRPSAIRPCTPCAVCQMCIWRWTPESEAFPRFTRPPIKMVGREWRCEERREHARSVGDAADTASPYGSGVSTHTAPDGVSAGHK